MKLNTKFFHRDCLDVAPDLVGKVIVRKFENGDLVRLRITETEAYRGIEDKACHASKGRTPRTELLYRDMGKIFTKLDNWSYYIITAYRSFEKLFGKKADKRRKLYNGRLECQYYQYLSKEKPPKNIK